MHVPRQDGQYQLEWLMHTTPTGLTSRQKGGDNLPINSNAEDHMIKTINLTQSYSTGGKKRLGKILLPN